MADRRRDRRKRPARSAPFRAPRKRFLVVCEGAVTEPEYLESVSRRMRNALVEIHVEGGLGVPLALVRKAIALATAARTRAKREHDDNLEFDQVWCVHDVDDHPNLNDARQLAAANGVLLAVSNPSFELWLLLHFRPSPGQRNRNDVRKMLGKFIVGYDKHVAEAMDDLWANYETAVKRSKKLDEEAHKAGEDGRNPTTGVHRLSEAIRNG